MRTVLSNSSYMKNIFILLLFAVTSVHSQKINLEYGKVSLNDFEVKSTDKRKVYDAIIIVNNTSVNFVSGFQYVSVHQRIRIESIDGLEYANQQINLLKFDKDEEEIVVLKGVTYNLSDNKIVTSDLNEKELLFQDLGKNKYSSFFSLPDVKVGSIIEIAYVIKSPFFEVENIAIQQEVPIINLNILFQAPRSQSYFIESNPLAQFKIDFPEKNFKKGVDVLKINKDRSKYINQDTQFQRIKSSGEPIVFSKKNIPALLVEPFSGELNKYQAKLVFSLAEGYDQTYNTRIESFKSSWKEVAGYLSGMDYFGDQLRSSRFFRKELENVLEGATDDKNKISKTLNFLKSKVKWNGEYGIYTDQGVKNAYRNGNGNVAEINLLLTSMLNESGIEAFPVIVSSTDHDTPLFPTIDGFDYVIVQVKVHETTFVLDATEDYFNLNRIPQRAANRKGMLIKKHGDFQWIGLTSNDIQKETTLLKMTLEDSFVVKGQGSKKLEDYMLLDPKMVQEDSSENAIKKFLTNNTFGLEIIDVKVDGLKDLSQNITFKYELDYINAFDRINNKISLQPLLNEVHLNDMVALKSRTTPLELSQPVEKTVVVNIEVPDGYVPVHLPESIKVVYGEEIGSYIYRIGFNNNIVSTVATYTMNTSIILPENYETFRQFFKAVLEKEAEKIILEKE